MSYTVVWMPNALRSLAAIWLAAANRNAVTAASNAIDRILESSPNTTGVVVFDTVREYAHGPLTVEFEVDDATQQVFVLNCWDAATGRAAPTGN